MRLLTSESCFIKSPENQTSSFLSCIRLSADDRLALIKDCNILFNSKSVEEGDDGEAYSSGQTYFTAANLKPRCLLEQLALDIFNSHSCHYVFDHTRSGAEWWVNVLDSRDDVGLHWDRDYGIEEEFGNHVYPSIATVTYLGTDGGPTVVFDLEGTKDNKEIREGSVFGCTISKPCYGKHLKFSGNLLHSAPSDLLIDFLSDDDEEDSYDEDDDDEDVVQRITFLVNIWLDKVPTQASDLPDGTLANLSPVVSTTPFLLPSSNQCNIATRYIAANSNKSRQWKFSQNGATYSLTMPLPCDPSLQDSFGDGDTLRLIYDASGFQGITIREESGSDSDADADADDDKDIGDETGEGDAGEVLATSLSHGGDCSHAAATNGISATSSSRQDDLPHCSRPGDNVVKTTSSPVRSEDSTRKRRRVGVWSSLKP